MECLNSNLLTEDFYNAGADPVSAIATAVGATTQGIGNIAQAKATKDASKLDIQKLVELNCGGKRRAIWGKKRKAKWDACAKKVQSESEKKSQAELERSARLKQAEIDANLKATETGARLKEAELELASRTAESGGKFLGMPKAVGITVAVVGGLALIVGGIFLVKKFRNK